MYLLILHPWESYALLYLEHWKLASCSALSHGSSIRLSIRLSHSGVVTKT